MNDSFITNIFVENSRNIKDLDIPLSKDKRQHLILTGKNGSGKTSLLLEIKKHLDQFDRSNFRHYELQKNYKRSLEQQLLQPNLPDRIQLMRNLKDVNDWFLGFGGTKISFSKPTDVLNDHYTNGELLLAYFDSKRHTNLNIPRGINKIELKKKYNLEERANSNFIQYIVNLKADRSFAKDDNEESVVKKIDDWFSRFENSLKFIFNVDYLELKFDRQSYNFNIHINKQEPFDFSTLSDGYSAIISIVTELLLRMEAHDVKSYDLQGIVIIDEIETHLHVDLQKKILPFLTDFFPNIQFIVTTHSPFVLSSLSNATICDLETRIVTEDLSNYSYDALIESYFRTDKYSKELTEKIRDFEKLVLATELSMEEEDYLRDLRNYFAHSPKYLSDELMVKLQEIELKELTTHKKKSE